MKQFSIIAGLLLALANSTFPSDKEVNVLRYYAVDNSLDGQPLVDKTNVLRFFPVFGMQDSIYSVQVTIHYDSNPFIRDANRMNAGKYWQVLLPKFRLGEAIRRLEVEVGYYLKKYFVKRYSNLLKKQEETLQFYELKLTKKSFKESILKNNMEFESIGISSVEGDRLRRARKDNGNYVTIRDNLIQNLIANEDIKQSDLVEVTNQVDALVKNRSSMLNGYQQDYYSLKDFRDSFKSSFDSSETQKDFLLHELYQEITSGLSDTAYSGPNVRKSDIVIEETDSETRPIIAKILYRNYKISLRHLPALDPAEKIGIFRLRYIPFPIIGGTKELELLEPLSSASPSVFEVGLSFGDAVVPGDQSVIPAFSLSRLGFAFAVTEKLFADEAQVRALVLTYDFNSFGSIGVGVNFQKEKTDGYFSFGINKRAFEGALAGLSKFFE